MRIYFIGQKGMPAKFGGVETHVEKLATCLVKAGHQVYVYTRADYTNPKLKEIKGVNLISLSTVATKHLGTIVHTLRACVDIRKRKVDIIHFHSIGPSSLIWLVKILKPGVPVVATFHTKCYEHQKWGKFAKLFLMLGERNLCLLADKVIAVSRSLTNYAKKKYKIVVDYIPNGVEVHKNIPIQEIKKWELEKDNYILVVSRLIRHKGIHHLIKAFQQIKTDKKLVIVGDGYYTDSYVIDLKTLIVGCDNIIFVGNQTGKVLAELFSNAFLFVQPSESEGLSLALLEAMSYGKCSLVSDIPENVEAIGNDISVFKNKDVDDLRDKLIYFLNNPLLVKECGERLKARVEKEYNLENIVNQTIKIYQQVVKML
ncbi:glycosyltransferase family 4 protein [Patescibacteria group bacterium]|nr:glycosyltransferase family 4 protein [Patescibacteria group bacterium]MBU0879326.1 glycosyltransferase family 4 protein [Patescibacteria group bacterium]MBU0880284.1 glycosyltransferase family 4 protein [Patescibacteria group bacterium]MBU1783592.1 glycosyltransferase family 4 protein [Patescibacteria group bacterium]